MIPAEARAGEPGFDAAFVAAVTVTSGILIGCWPGQGVVAPFAGDGVDADERGAAHIHPAAGAGTDDHAEDHFGALCRAVGGLGDHEAVGVVFDFDLAIQLLLQIVEQRLADQPGGIGVLDPAAGRGDGAGDADADAGGLAGLAFQLPDEIDDGFDGGGIVVARGVDALSGLFGALRVEQDAFDLGAAQIDPDTHGLVQQFGVVVGIGRRATAQDMQRFVADVLDAMGGAGGDGHGVADVHFELVFAQGHPAAAAGDVIELFALAVAMQFGDLAGMDDGLGQALVLIAVHTGVHQLADLRAVFGGVGFDVLIAGVTHDRSGLQLRIRSRRMCSTSSRLSGMATRNS